MIFAYINDKSIEDPYYFLVLRRLTKKQSSGIDLSHKMGKTLGVIYNISCPFPLINVVGAT